MSVTVKQYYNNFASRYAEVKVQSVAVAENEMEYNEIGNNFLPCSTRRTKQRINIWSKWYNKHISRNNSSRYNNVNLTKQKENH